MQLTAGALPRWDGYGNHFLNIYYKYGMSLAISTPDLFLSISNHSKHIKQKPLTELLSSTLTTEPTTQETNTLLY